MAIPALRPPNFANTTGIQNTHLMATGASGLTTAQREVERKFGQLETAKLEFGEGLRAATPGAVNEQAGAHNTAAPPSADVHASAAFRPSMRPTSSQQYRRERFLLLHGQRRAKVYRQYDVVLLAGNPEFQSGYHPDPVAGDGTTILASNDDIHFNGNVFNGTDNASLYSGESIILNFACRRPGPTF